MYLLNGFCVQYVSLGFPYHFEKINIHTSTKYFSWICHQEVDMYRMIVTSEATTSPDEMETLLCDFMDDMHIDDGAPATAPDPELPDVSHRRQGDKDH